MSRNINFSRCASNSLSGPLGTNLVLLLLTVSGERVNRMFGARFVHGVRAEYPPPGAPANVAGSEPEMLAAPRAAANMSTNSPIDLFIATPRFPLQSLGYESFNLEHFPSV